MRGDTAVKVMASHRTLLDGFALVTGAGSGIGRQCALAYAQEGAAGVALADINESALLETGKLIEKEAIQSHFKWITIVVDVSKEAEVTSMIDKTIEAFGRLDYAFNAAGVAVQQPAEIADASISEFSRLMTVNVYGTFLCVRAQSRAMKLQNLRPHSSSNPKRGQTRGVIVNMGSAAGHTATPLLTQYTTSKHAVIGLTKNAALDNAIHGIRVVSVSASWVDTPMVRAAVQADPALQHIIDHAIPMQRVATVDEISDIVVFLSSSKASYVTGSDWLVDGGTLTSAQ